MSKGIKLLLGVVTLASLVAGCNTDDKTREVIAPQNNTKRETSIVRRVPVLEYTVRKRDIPIRLIKKELDGSRDFSIPEYGEPRATQDDIRMQGDDDSNALVSYFFTVPQILESLNGDRSMQGGYWQPYEYPLMAGERLLVPDFNLDGRINGIPGETKGYLEFDCSRDGTYATKKELRYIPKDRVN